MPLNSTYIVTLLKNSNNNQRKGARRRVYEPRTSLPNSAVRSSNGPYRERGLSGEVRAKKSLGQHFLTDLTVAERIAAAMQPEQPSCLPGDSHTELPVVLEVGCGTGVLTQFLLERSDMVLFGAEVDRQSIAYLHNHFPLFAPRLIDGDFLKLPLSEMFPSGVRIIGNFPYNISSQIFFKVLDNRNLVPEVVGMVQREVALRIASPAGSRDYGILSVLLQAWYDIEYLFTVSENVFNPPPKVKSAVIRLVRNSRGELGCNEELFVRVVKASFGQRRKMLRNALGAVFDFGGAEHPFFTRRAETLSVDEFVELTLWVELHVAVPAQ